MAEKLCTLRTKGGGGAQQTETVLWTNSSPSSNFASQTITLSDSMTNYDYLKVTYINATGSSVSNIDIVPVSAFITTGTQTIRSALGAVGTTGGATRDFARNYKYVADNQINFGTASALNYAAAENNRIIPTAIIGIKNMGGIRTNEKYDMLPVKSLAAGANAKFTAKDAPKAIWVSFIPTSQARMLIVTNVNPYTGEINNNAIYQADSNNLNNYILSSRTFTVTGNSIDAGSLSSVATYVSCSYTY